jgi:hypothetical protein
MLILQEFVTRYTYAGIPAALLLGRWAALPKGPERL